MMGTLVVNGSTSGLKTETKEKYNLLKKYKRNCGKRNKCSLIESHLFLPQKIHQKCTSMFLNKTIEMKLYEIMCKHI